MSDLVERLRDWSDGPETSALCEASADRIEQLERVLAQAREALYSCTPGDYSTGHVIHPSFDDDAVDQAIAAIDEALNHQASG